MFQVHIHHYQGYGVNQVTIIQARRFYTTWKPVQLLRNGKLLKFPEYKVNEVGAIFGRRGKLLKPSNERYPTVCLCDNYSLRASLHRIVASTFLPLPQDMFQVVHHINNVSADFRACNLMWTSSRENSIKNAHKNGRTILQFSAETGELMNTWPKVMDAAKVLDIHHSKISKACKLQKLCAGYLWRYPEIENYPSENWKSLISSEFSLHYPNYSISDYGRFRNDKTTRLLKPSLDTSGYLKVRACHTKPKPYFIHRLVAIIFMPSGYSDVRNEIDHIDGTRTNNHVSNLRWVSSSENKYYFYESLKARKKVIL